MPCFSQLECSKRYFISAFLGMGVGQYIVNAPLYRANVKLIIRKIIALITILMISRRIIPPFFIPLVFDFDCNQLKPIFLHINKHCDGVHSFLPTFIVPIKLVWFGYYNASKDIETTKQLKFALYSELYRFIIWGRWICQQ